MTEDVERIAVIGMSGRFPGAANVEEFWQNLRAGKESIRQFSDKELRHRGVPEEFLANPDYVKAGTVLEDADCFDADFFGYSPREARLTDPQHRLFLQSSWAALEDAGYNPELYDGAISIYAGVGLNNYVRRLGIDPTDPITNYQIMIGNDKDYMVTRVAYLLNLRGESVAVQTACSTSLVAIHLAAQSLLNYQSDMALAGGVSVFLPQNLGYFYCAGMTMSPDGHCRAFDAAGKGFVNGRGLGLVVLKRLSEALQEGDNIRAVLRSSAINNDGSGKIGYTAPSIDGQAEVITTALALADINPESIGYVEAFGTGTPLGDPIEVAALTAAFRSGTQRTQCCAIGSVKTNIGHLDTAAGAAGFIKTVLALEHAEIPPSLHFEKPNPEIDFESSPFFVCTELRPWQTQATAPRRAGVSSFGIGGTNAHVILEQAPIRAASHDVEHAQLLVTSGRTDATADANAAQLRAALGGGRAVNFADAAFTLQIGRKHFKHRRMLVCRSRKGLADTHSWQSGTVESEQQTVAFVFPDQGVEFIDMGADLYRRYSVFQDTFDLCAEIFNPLIEEDMRACVFADGCSNAEARQRLMQSTAVQPVHFAIEYALFTLWKTIGIEPDAVAGFSLGEYTAACVAGVFSLEDALALVALRGRIMHAAPTGLTVAPLLLKFATVVGKARLNPPSLPVVSGASGSWLTTAQATDSHYWTQQISQPVTVAKSVSTLVEHSQRVLLEVGPSRMHASTAAAVTHQHGLRFVNSLSLGQQDGDEEACFTENLGRLWLVGVEPDWQALYKGEQRRRVSLPTYSFARTRYWVDEVDTSSASGALSDLHEAAEPAHISNSVEANRVGDAVASRGAEPTLDSQYAERILRSIWIELLGVDNVRLDDNFYALGGDSLLGLSVVSRCRKANLALTSRHVIDHPTIAELVTCSQWVQFEASDVDDLEIVGEFPLTPNLQRYLSRTANADHWNVSIFLRPEFALDTDLLRRSIALLEARHATLRQRFERTETGWSRRIVETETEDIPLSFFDLSNEPKAQQIDRIHEIAAALNAGFALAQGPLYHVAHINLDNAEQRLLLVTHHFVAEGLSLGILIEDLACAYAQQLGKSPGEFPMATASVMQWADGLQKLADSALTLEKMGYWSNLPWSKIKSMPFDFSFEEAALMNKYARQVQITLTATETQQLQRSGSASLEELLISALALAYMQWSHQDTFLVERLGHGRAADMEVPLDVTRTAGFFLSYSPILITDLNPTEAAVTDLTAIVRAYLRRDQEFDLLRWMTTDTLASQQFSRFTVPQLSFNYRGRFDQLLPSDLIFQPAPENVGRHEHNPEGFRYYPLGIVADATGDGLNIRFVYSNKLHAEQSIRKLSDAFLRFIKSSLSAH